MRFCRHVGPNTSMSCLSEASEEASCIFAGHVNSKVHQTVGIAPLVVVPGHQLHERVVERNACTYIENGGKLAAHEVSRHNLVLGPVKNALHVSSSGFLHSCHDLIVLGRPFLLASRSPLGSTCPLPLLHQWRKG